MKKEIDDITLEERRQLDEKLTHDLVVMKSGIDGWYALLQNYRREIEYLNEHGRRRTRKHLGKKLFSRLIKLMGLALGAVLTTQHQRNGHDAVRETLPDQVELGKPVKAPQDEPSSGKNPPPDSPPQGAAADRPSSTTAKQNGRRKGAPKKG